MSPKQLRPNGRRVLSLHQKTWQPVLLRLCGDYHKLNADIVRDSFSIRQTDECIDRLQTANEFSPLHANSSYLQIELDENDMGRTAFLAHNELYKYTRMQSSLKKAPAISQHGMEVILAPVKWQHALLYINDVFIFSKTPDAHSEHFESVLQLINKAGKMLKPKKHFFCLDAIDYVGHVITSGRLYIATRIVDAVHGLKYPTPTSSLRSFLGLCNVHRRFTANV